MEQNNEIEKLLKSFNTSVNAGRANEASQRLEIIHEFFEDQQISEAVVGKNEHL